MEGHAIERADVRRADLRWPLPEKMAERLAGCVVTALRRRSKYILADLSSGETLIIHLGMSGRMLVSGSATAGFHHDTGTNGMHDHVVLTMSSGVLVTFNDPRRFGMMDIAPTTSVMAHRLLASLGPEPLGNTFNEAYLRDRLKHRSGPIKTVLLDQKLVAGLGNIYVCEALHRARISPKARASSLSAARAGRLVSSIRDVLREAIEAGGSSLRDHRRPDGELGYFQHAFRVYGREGKPCRTEGCKGVIRRIGQAGRSTYYCPQCQR